MPVLVRWLGECIGTNILFSLSSFKQRATKVGAGPAAILAFVLALFPGKTLGSFERIIHPPAFTARGSASAFADDIEALSFNPSSAAALQAFSVSAFFTPSPFDLPQLSNGGVVLAIPSAYCNCAVTATSIGFSLYREQTASATFARSFEQSFFVGCTIAINDLFVERYGSASSIGIDLGASVQLMDDVRWGFSLLNINRPTIGALKDELPVVYVTGVSWRVLAESRISLNLVDDVRYPVSLRVGIEASPVEFIDIRLGLTTEPSRYCAGIGLRFMPLSIDYGVQTQTELGLTQSFGISIHF